MATSPRGGALGARSILRARPQEFNRLFLSQPHRQRFTCLGVAELLAHLRHRGAGLRRELGDLLVHILVARLQAVLLRDRVEKQCPLHLAIRSRAQLVAQLVEIEVQRPRIHSALRHRVEGTSKHRVHAAIHHHPRDIERVLVHQLLDDLLSLLLRRLPLRRALQIATHLSLQALQRLGRLHFVGERIVQLWGHLPLQSLELNVEARGPAPHLLHGVVAGKGVIDIAGFTDAGALERADIALDQLSLGDLDGDVLRLAAGKVLAVDERLIIDQRPVTPLRDVAIRNWLQPRHHLPHPLQLLADLLVADRDFLALQLQSFVTLGIDLRTHLDARLERERLLWLETGGIGDLRAGNGLHVVLANGLQVRALDDVLDHVVLDLLLEALLENAPRDLAWPKAGDLHLAPERAVGPIELPDDLRALHFDRQLAFNRRELLDLSLHLRSLLEAMGGEGLEPSHLAVPDPKSGASTNSATRPTIRRNKIEKAEGENPTFD